MDPEHEIETGAAASTAEQEPSPGGTDEGGASSAPAAGEPQTAAEAVRDAFLKEYGDGTTTPEAGAEDTATVETQPEEAPAERQEGAEEPKGKARLTDEEWKSLSPKVRARIGYLTEQMRTAKADAGQVETFRADSETLGHLRTFASEAGMSGQDVSNALALGAMLSRGDYAGFLKEMEPIYRRAMQAAGREATPELQALVDSGEVTPEIANRLTQQERAAERLQAQATREREAREADQQTRTTADNIAAMKTAVTDAETALRASDPEYALKEQAVRQQFGAMLKRGAMPKDAADAAAMIREIHAGIRVARPAPRATAATPTASEPPRRAAAPTNVRDAVRSVLGR